MTPARRDFARGETLALSLDMFWELVRGEVVVICHGRPVEVWRAPCRLDVAGTVRGARSVVFGAVTDVEVRGVPRASVDEPTIIAALAEETERLWRRVDADARRDDDTFLARAVAVPGPWHFRSARTIALVVQGDPAKLRIGLPRGVHLLPGGRGRYVIALARFDGVGSTDERDASQFGYAEVTPFVPVISGVHPPAAFVPELYPDAWMATILGREIHGFPKRTARVAVHEHGGELIVDRRVALRVRYTRRTPVEPAVAIARFVEAMAGRAWVGRGAAWLFERFEDRGLGFDVLVHKRVGACETAGRTFAIDEVVRVPFALDPVVAAATLDDLEVELRGGGVLHGEVITGVYLETGFRFDGGTVERRPGTRGA